MKFQLYQEINFLRNKKLDEGHFNRLFRAICLVDKKYLEIKIESSMGKSDLIKHKERVFAYELYHQWANILDAECKNSLTLNAELDKIISDDIYKAQRKVLTYPDLVLHQGQGNNKKQKIICEIKRNDPPKRYAKLFADLYKLSCYLDKRKMGASKFDYGVFILLSTPLDDITKIKERTKIKVNDSDYSFLNFRNEMSEFFNRIICVSYDGKKLEYETLCTLIDCKN